jgi:hypothetical protein
MSVGRGILELDDEIKPVGSRTVTEFETELRQQVAEAYRALQEAQAEDEPGAIKAYSQRMGYLVEIAEEHGVDLAELELSAHGQ